MDRAATFDETGMYRYTLTRTWDLSGDRKHVCFVMLNPSTADAFKEDATIRRCIGMAKRLDASGLFVVNLFAFRATDPKALKGAMDPIGPDNYSYVRDACRKARQIICAWGAHPMAVAEARALWPILSMSPALTVCYGTTKSGAPKHPLYLPNDVGPQEFSL